MHKDIHYLNRTGMFHIHESEMKKPAPKLPMTSLLLVCNVIFYYTIAYYFSHRMPASFSAQDVLLWT